MADRASIVQASFLGGEYSPAAYGRTAEPQYLTALARCLNAQPIEEGPWERRSGWQRIIPTIGRGAAKLLSFLASTTCSFVVVATLDAIQFVSGASPIFTNDSQLIPAASSLAAGLITLTTNSAHGWAVGDYVMLQFPVGYAVTSEANCRGRIFKLVAGTVSATKTLVMGDDLGNALPTFSQTWVDNTSLVGATVLRVLKFTTTYAAADLPNLRLVQAQNAGIILTGDVSPQALQVTTPAPGADPVFTFGTLTMVDGPYLDPQTQSLTLSALTGAVTVTAGSAAFTVTKDVGRHMRVFTQPTAYNPAHAYSVGDLTTDVQGEWWTCVVANTGQVPGQPGVSAGIPTVFWVPNPTAGTWAWGKLTAVASTTSATWTIDTTIPGMVLATANGMTASFWQLGVYSGSTTYPTCGTFFEGRLYFGGAVPNRFDTAVANGLKNTTATFSPTDPWDNVIDTSGISLTLNANTLNNFNWFRPAYGGIVVGTFEGEWLISASTLGDPITPTSIQAHLITRYGSANIEPVGTGMSIMFPQRYDHRMYEYIDDAFTQKFSGKPFNEKALHLFPSGTVELAYQDEATPTVWARQADGTLNGCTYRRVSRFITEDPKFNGWHPHRHGAPGGKFTGIACVPAEAGTSDLLYSVVQDRFGYWVELQQPLMPATAGISDGWFIDAAVGQITSVTLKCGNLLPSVGQAALGTVAATDWGAPIPAAPISLPVPGQPIPPAIIQAGGVNFVMKNMGVYFNGYSALLNLLPPALSMTKYSLSVWLYAQADQGVLFGTPFASPDGTADGISASGVAAHEQCQVVGQYGANRLNCVVTDGAGNATFHGLVTSITGQGHWTNLLMSNDGAGHNQCYMMETLIDNTDTTNVMINPTVIGGMAIGGHSFFSRTGSTSSPLYNFAGGSILPGGGDGYLGGMAEFWFTTHSYIDFSVAGNRALFHVQDPLSVVDFYPANLGPSGTAVGAAPDIYLSGGQKGWTVNRARKLLVRTYNAGGHGTRPGYLDPLPVNIVGI